MRKKSSFSELIKKQSNTESEELLIEDNDSHEIDDSMENLRASKEFLKDMSLSESSSEENEVSMLRQPSNATILGILDGHSKRSSEEFRKPNHRYCGVCDTAIIFVSHIYIVQTGL